MSVLYQLFLRASVRLLVVVAALLSGFSSAAADQTHPELDRLFQALRGEDEADAQRTVARILTLWSDAQSDTVDLLYARAAASVEAQEWDLAGALLDHALGLAPSFAQGYALRAIVRLHNENQDGAVTDLNRTIELEPRHFHARIALAEIMASGGRKEEAYAMLQRALEWNPHAEAAREEARRLRREIDGQEI